MQKAETALLVKARKSVRAAAKAPAKLAAPSKPGKLAGAQSTAAAAAEDYSCTALSGGPVPRCASVTVTSHILAGLGHRFKNSIYRACLMQGH